MLSLKREGNVFERMLVKMQVVTLSEFCRIVKKGLFFFLKETKRKSSLEHKGEDHGRYRELGAVSKNPPVYGKRHVLKV